MTLELPDGDSSVARAARWLMAILVAGDTRVAASFALAADLAASCWDRVGDPRIQGH